MVFSTVPTNEARPRRGFIRQAEGILEGDRKGVGRGGSMGESGALDAPFRPLRRAFRAAERLAAAPGASFGNEGRA